MPKKDHSYGRDTVVGWWRVFRALIRWAWEDGTFDLVEDVTNGILVGRHLNKALRWRTQRASGPQSLTADEVGRFLAQAKWLYPQYHALMFLGFHTGMRWEELSALCWDDFDRERWVITVRRSQVRGHLRQRTKSGAEKTSISSSTERGIPPP